MLQQPFAQCWVCAGFVLGLCWVYAGFVVCAGAVLGLCWVCAAKRLQPAAQTQHKPSISFTITMAGIRRPQPPTPTSTHDSGAIHFEPNKSTSSTDHGQSPMRSV